jgi:hypothetical protein
MKWLLVALCVAVLSLAGTADAKPIQHHGGDNGNPASRQAETPAPKPEPGLAFKQADIERLTKAVEAIGASGSGPDEKKDAKDNLDAQRQMAEAARNTVIVASFEAAITFIGVLLVAWTLYHTKRAADAAQRTLNELESPFIYPVKVIIEWGQEIQYFDRYPNPTSGGAPGRPKATFRLQNFGRAPAILRSVGVGFERLSTMVESPRANHLSDAVTESVLQRDAITERPFSKVLQNELTREDYANLKEGHSYLYIYGEVAFSDVGGIEYLQTFALAWDFKRKAFIPLDARYNKRLREPQNPS